MEQRNTDTLPVSNTIKGIAISAVLVNHYLNNHISPIYTGFANQFIALFYMGSGYGLYYSLSEAMSTETAFSEEDLFRFYRDRAIRIFPLYWIALIVSGKILPWYLAGLHGPGHLWFIPTLLQCYALAPFLFTRMRENKIRLIALVILTVAGLNLLYCLGSAGHAMIKLISFFHGTWRNALFLYIVLFTLGLWLPSFLEPKQMKHPILAKLIFWLLLAATLWLMIILKYFVDDNLFLRIMPLLALALIFVYAFRYCIAFRALAYLGNISYSIYLFHPLYYKLIDRIGFEKGSLANLAICILLLPLFIYGCSKMEEFGKSIATKLKVSIKHPIFKRTRAGY